MYISLKWLKEFVKVPNKVTPQDLGFKLTLHTVEIDSVVSQADRFKDVVVGRVLSVGKHPDADRLCVARVSIGKEEKVIVCGADNISAGDLVPVALPGASLAGGATIKEAEIRGVRSYGMLCAEDELGLGDDHSGIMILKKGKPGQNISSLFRMDDTIYEVDNKSITHRPDLWSHIGMAREVAAFLGTHMTAAASDILHAKPPEVRPGSADFTVEVRDQEKTPRYMAACVEGVAVGPSPDWIKERLVAAGIRPINNVVDITNYVLCELGQPMHAFDFDKVSQDGSAKLIVRTAAQGEKLVTLDGAERELDPSMLVIANASRTLALAGIMGGSDSEITPDTRTILLESANFEAVSTRKTSQKLGLRTESSVRFEKSLDPALCEIALYRAISLLCQVCPGAKTTGKITDHYPSPQAPSRVAASASWIKQRIGTDLSMREIRAILERQGFTIEKTDDNLSIGVPSWRAAKDISIPEDIVEEIARIYGYDNIHPQMPFVEMHSVPKNARTTLKKILRAVLINGAALAETYNYSFVGEDQLKKLGIDYSKHLKLANPIASNLTMLRQSLVPNMIEAIKKNQAREREIGIFEIGNVYLSSPGELPLATGSGETLPFQQERLGICASGTVLPALFQRMKGIVELIAFNLGLQTEFRPKEIAYPWADGTLKTAVLLNEKEVGEILAVDRTIARKAGLKHDLVVSEIFLPYLEELAGRSAKLFREFEKYPPAIRDLSFVVDERILYNDIRQAIFSASPLLADAELFDEYSGEKLGSGRKSLAFRLTYRADKTLSSEEVEAAQAMIIEELGRRFSAKIRDF